MTIDYYETQFYGLPVVEFNPQQGIENPSEQVYRLAVNYEQEIEVQNMLETFLNDPRVTKVPALIIGNWNAPPPDEGSPESLLQQLIKHRKKLPNLKALFVGDMTYEENEISWIIQTDYTPFLNAFPKLELLRVRGSDNLQFSQLKHNRLKTLIIECGGLPSFIIESIINAHLPALQHLELWLGIKEYGFDGNLQTIKPLFKEGLFPKLRYLGLRDSDIVDDIAIEIANAPILDQLEILDLSLGTLTDKGAQALLDSDGIKTLTKLDLHYHYMSTSMMEKLEKLGIEEIDVSEQQQEEEYDDEDIYRFVAVSE